MDYLTKMCMECSGYTWHEWEDNGLVCQKCKVRGKK